ncbi:MAG: nicotinate (nicotinamide) nucleotide adenylyltransferase [Desulfamplus sp.]|nr:nicotinate (nicotinamide) nucleotide adenylyltransferase [Desulfamplus sp.]MBF0413886.1 nicotinate (nicotinamide) nucleotide adenylyltransferase [Desulfamplus sp.]
MNVGLFGGTFNPIHQGHIEVITYVKSTFKLNAVHIIPSAIPPHKTPVNLAPAKERFEMVQQAVANIPGLIASDIETLRKGKSFSIDTIKYFKNIMEENTRLYFVMGSDAFFDINTWKNSIEIFRLTNIIVMQRAGDTRKLKDIELFMQKTISPCYEISQSDNTIKYHYLKAEKILKNSCPNHDFKTVHICYVPEIPISSTMIRDKIKAHQSIEGFVPPVVKSIIYEKKLYL